MALVDWQRPTTRRLLETAMPTTNFVLLAFSVGTFSLGQVLALGQKSIALEDLTVPTERLPVTCRLTNLTSLDVSHDAFIAALRSIRPLLVTTNPWIERCSRMATPSVGLSRSIAELPPPDGATTSGFQDSVQSNGPCPRLLSLHRTCLRHRARPVRRRHARGPRVGGGRAARARRRAGEPKTAAGEAKENAA